MDDEYTCSLLLEIRCMLQSSIVYLNLKPEKFRGKVHGQCGLEG